MERKLPIYEVIANEIRNKILNGEIAFGELLPTELQIQEEYKVSRVTARGAFKCLENEGLISRKSGVGTFVAWKPGLVEIPLGQDEKQDDFHYSEKEEFRMLSQTASAALGINKQTRFFSKVVIASLNKVKMNYSVSYYLSADFDEIEAIDQKPADIALSIRTVLPPDGVCEQLKINKKQPMILKQLIYRNDEGRIIKYSETYYRGDRYYINIKIS